MSDDERFEKLEAEIADQRRLRAAHEDMRSTAVDALSGINKRLAHLQDAVTASNPVHPELLAAREASSPQLYAKLSGRLGSMEQYIIDLTKIVADNNDLMGRVLEWLKRPGQQD